jgi:RNA polymerase sigma-70 factor, ECF subfamily
LAGVGAKEAPALVTEDALLAAARRGDHRAFAALLDRYDRPLRALAYRVLGDRNDMDDAMQEAAVKAFVSLGSFDGRSSFGTWLYRITYTACLNLLRARRSVPDPLDVAGHDEAGEHGDGGHIATVSRDLAGAVGRRIDLEDALRMLSTEQRAAVCVVMELGFSLDQAAEILGVPPGTVSSRLWHARAILRRSLLSSATVEVDHGSE